MDAAVCEPKAQVAHPAGSPKSQVYSRSWNGRVVVVAVVPEASKKTASGATPEVRAATCEGSVIAGDVTAEGGVEVQETAVVVGVVVVEVVVVGVVVVGVVVVVVVVVVGVVATGSDAAVCVCPGGVFFMGFTATSPVSEPPPHLARPKIMSSATNTPPKRALDTTGFLFNMSVSSRKSMKSIQLASVAVLGRAWVSYAPLSYSVSPGSEFSMQGMWYTVTGSA